MEKPDISYSSITVTDKDGNTLTLGEYLRKDEDKKKTVEIDSSFKDESGKFVPTLPVKHLPEKMAQKHPKGVVRTKVYSKDQIKQMEEKAMANTTIKSIEAIHSKPGWWTVRDIADEIGAGMSSVSSIISQMYNVWQNSSMLDRKRPADGERGFLYLTGDKMLTMSPGEILRAYNDAVREKKAASKSIKYEVDNSIDSDKANKPISNVMNTVKQAVDVDKPLNVNININVRFGLIRG